MNRPRRHHFVPRFYLKGFTDSGEAAGFLHVLDRSLVKRWKATPDNVAHQRDMYEVEDGPDPAAMEKCFATLEGKFDAALQGVIQTRRLPSGDDWNVLLNFLTIMAVRVPRIKEAIEEVHDTISKRVLRQWTSTPEGMEFLKRTVKQGGGDPNDIDSEAFREFVNSDDYAVCYGQNWYLKMMIEATKTVLPLLTARNWVLREVPLGLPDLVTSDMPLTINGDSFFPATDYMPGFGMKHTLAVFPIDKRAVMLGSFEGPLSTAPLTKENIANLNSAAARAANQVYSSQPDFVCLLKDGRIGTASDVFGAWIQRRD